MKKIVVLFVSLLFAACSKSVNYSADHILETSGRYLYAADEVLEVYYENNELLLKWRGAERIKPVVLDENTFFVADMYKKLRFVDKPNTNDKYLSIVDPENEDLITYDFIKLTDSSDIPSEHLKNENYEKALAGYLKIKEEDPNSDFLDEYYFNRLGYKKLGDKEYENAIEIFKMNVALFPESSNVYDSLADAYLRSGDSLQAFNNYEKALELDDDNPRALKFINAYNKSAGKDN